MAPSHPAVFTTQTPYPLPPQKFMIPSTWSRYQLSQLINKALALAQPIPFDFLLHGDILKTRLSDWCSQNGVGEEETLEIEYIESVLPPQKISDLPHDDWVSSVSCRFEQLFVTASYDGSLRAFDYSQTQTWSSPVHAAPITAFCAVSSTSSGSHIIATASHDLTAQLNEVSFGTPENTKRLASLHLHTAPLSAITCNLSGTQLLTASWDSLVGLWDTRIPDEDEVPEAATGDRKKRRKVQEERPKRKAPLMVLKSHTARVSAVIFASEGEGAISCGLDSTVRSWDLEHGVSTNTLTLSERPFVSMCSGPAFSPRTVLAASTDRTITQYDCRETQSIASLTLTHPTTPSCVVSAPSHPHQVLSGAYDGVARIWDLRSVKGATPVASFKAWEDKKILDVSWKTGGIVAIGGGGGLSIWKVGEEQL
ncbi:unnamed protein product [Mycena citricolor]|uniref:NLE domain-containing protein n=1 Tax=Mycena citricolor TaxID=2018698 RepID=A0AAD2HR23_9AGAR|nr:unnamed protein product [Mycena citricolor]CAK5279530.1 unnamed protein product [Mycena citricolor]